MRGDAERKWVASTVCDVKGAEGVSSGTFSVKVAHIGLPPDKSRTHDVLRPGSTPPHWASFGGYNHSMLSGDMPAGKVFLYEQGRDVIGDGIFFDTPAGQAMRGTMKGLGDLVQLSVEYRTTREGNATEAEKAAGAGRIIEAWEVFGVSLVQEGAMPFTGLTSIKCDRCRAAQPSAAEMEQLARETERTLAKAAAILWTPADEAALKRHLGAFNAQQGTTPGVRVDPAKHRAALDFVQWAAARWRIVPPKVKWVHSCDMPDARWSGFSLGGAPDTVHLRSDLSGNALASVCFHEVDHVGRKIFGLTQQEREVEEDVRHMMAAYLRGEP